MIRRFLGYRREVPQHYLDGGYGAPPDEVQYEGVVFSDGVTILRWQTDFRSTSVWASFADMMKVHGHDDYGTEIVWLDEVAEPPARTGGSDLASLAGPDQD